MSRAEDEESRKAQSHKQKPAEFPADHPADDVPEDPNLSNAVKDALVTTGKLWTRETGPEAAWSAQHRSHASLPEKTVAALCKKSEGSTKKKAQEKQRKIYQEKAYTTWTQLQEDD